MADNGDGSRAGYGPDQRGRGHAHPTRDHGPMRGKDLTHVHDAPVLDGTEGQWRVGSGHTHDRSAVGPLGPARYEEGAYGG